MPILPPEPFVYPTNLFAQPDDTLPDALADGEWLVMHTRSRAEKALARWLLSASIRFFLPLYKKRSRQNGREQISYPPLFPGYVFVYGTADERYHALASNCVAQCLKVSDPECLEADLADVYRLITGERPVAPTQPLAPGTQVEVIDGPFAGMTGTLVQTKTQRRLIVSVRMINQGVAVELDRCAVRPFTEGGCAERARLALIRG